MKKRICHLFAFLFALIVFFITYQTIYEILYVTFFPKGKYALNLTDLASFLITQSIFYVIFRIIHFKDVNKSFKIYLFIIPLLISQYYTLLIDPAITLVPKVILTRSKILVDADYDGSYNWDNKLCKNKTRFDKAKLFMKDDVADVEDIEMYFLGKSIITYPARFIPIDSGIYTSSDTIYIIAAKAGCIDDITIVHELTHVWQNQNENTIKMKDTLEEYKNMIKYFTKRDDLYSYGGIAGLESAKNSGMTFKDFGEEQQARMVEDYYTIKHSNLKYFTDDLEPLLQYFLEPEFNFAKE